MMNAIAMVKGLLAKEVVIEDKQPIMVTLYARSTSKASSKRKCWYWTTRPSLYALANDIPVLRTKVQVDISELNYQHSKGDYTVLHSSPALQRKLLSISKPYTKK